MDSAVVLATRVWFLVATIGIQSLLAWMLGPEGRGAFAVCFVFGILFSLIFTIGVDRAAQHFVMNKELSLSQSVTTGVIIAIIGSAIAMFVGWLLIQTPISFFQKASTSEFELSLFVIPSWILNTFLLNQLNGLQRFVSSAVITVVQTTTNLFLVVVFLGFLGLGVKGALLAQVISHALAIAMQVRDLRVHCGLRLVLPQWSHYWSIVHYGARYLVANLGHMVDVQLGVILLGLIASQHEIGLFSAAAAMSLKTAIFAQSIETSMLPRIAVDQERRIEIVCRCLRLTSLLTGITLIVLVTLSIPIVQVLLSPSFLPAVPLIWILAPGLLIVCWWAILAGYYRVINRPGFVSWSIWMGLMTNTVLFFALYPTIGVFAAACSMSLGLIVRTLVLLESFRRGPVAGLSQMLWPRRGDIQLIKISLVGIFAKLSTLRRKRP